MPLKNIYDVADTVTGCSSRQKVEASSATEDQPWRRLSHACVVRLGKSLAHEYAFGGTCAPTPQTWDVEKVPGGSNGGSAAAVAAEFVPAPMGTDTDGSIRSPDRRTHLDEATVLHGVIASKSTRASRSYARPSIDRWRAPWPEP